MKINRDKYLHHITDKDKVIDMRRIIDKVEMVMNNHVEESTDFLDPYERSLGISILNRFSEIDYIETGGISQAERQIITIFPYYKNSSNIKKEIKSLRVTGDLSGLSHKDYLGSILALGISRNKIGDILIHEEYVDFIVKNELSDFIILNLEKIGNKNIAIEKINMDKLLPVESEYKEVKRVLSSKRIDVYISACYNISRRKSASIIKSNGVKINWETIEKPSEEVNKGDVISVRGYGRSTFYSFEGLTRKDNLKATIRILI